MRDVRVGVRFVSALAALSLLGLSAGVAWGQGAPAVEVPKTVVLNTYGIWRFHCTIEPPVLASGETVKLKHVWLNTKTSGPDKDWTAPDFDDQFWNRGPVTLAVYTATGRLVQRVIDREMLAGGAHTMTWDGRTLDGQRAAAGVYLFRLDTGERVELRRGVLLR